MVLEVTTQPGEAHIPTPLRVDTHMPNGGVTVTGVTATHKATPRRTKQKAGQRQAPRSQILQLSSGYQEQSPLRLWEFFLLSVYLLPHRYSSKFLAKTQGVQKQLEKNQTNGTLGIESPMPAGMYGGE